jgi:hypothetical protein
MPPYLKRHPFHSSRRSSIGSLAVVDAVAAALAAERRAAVAAGASVPVAAGVVATALALRPVFRVPDPGSTGEIADPVAAGATAFRAALLVPASSAPRPVI